MRRTGCAPLSLQSSAAAPVVAVARSSRRRPAHADASSNDRTQLQARRAEARPRADGSTVMHNCRKSEPSAQWRHPLRRLQSTAYSVTCSEYSHSEQYNGTYEARRTLQLSRQCARDRWHRATDFAIVTTAVQPSECCRSRREHATCNMQHAHQCAPIQQCTTEHQCAENRYIYKP